MVGALRGAWVLLSAASLAGCSGLDVGLAPPLGELYFPTGLSLSPGASSLYVIGSDFDLQYTGGTVVGLDWSALRSEALGLAESLDAGPTADACASRGLTRNDEAVLHPGPCEPIGNDQLAPHVRGTAVIGAFGTQGALVTRPDQPGARLFVPVRGDPSVTYLDIADDRADVGGSWTGCEEAFCLRCGAGDDSVCASTHRVGTEPERSQRNVELPTEPFGIAASSDPVGLQPIVALHQLDPGSASLVVNDWNATPSLEFVLGSLPAGATELAAVPAPAWTRAASGVRYLPTFVATYRSSAQLDLLRFDDDAGSVPPRPFLGRSQTVPITQLASGVDGRGVAIDASARQACEAACNAELSCLRACIDVPLGVYAVNRSPPSLVVAELETSAAQLGGGATSAFDTLRVRDVVPLATGASRIGVGRVVEADGSFGVRVFVAAFDSRQVFSYDPAHGFIDAVIRTGRGPQALAFDWGEGPSGPYSLLLVAQFTDSYVSVVDLDTRRSSFGSVVLGLGTPKRPREEQ